MKNLVRFGCAVAAVLLFNAAYAVYQPAQAQSTTIVISEFRTRGPAGANDEFVELTNISAAAVDISGYTMRGSNNAATVSIRATVPASTSLPPGGHYLIVNDQTTGTNEYSLGGYPAGGTNAAPTGATGNLTFVTGITDDGGIAIFAADGTTIVDQVGMSAGSAYGEGTRLTPMAADAVSDYSYVRKLTTGTPQDTNNNSGDFQLVSTDGNVAAVVAILGAPGPENLSGPIQQNALIKPSLVDTGCASSTGPDNVTTCARNRNPTPGTFPGGTVSIRRTFKNNTGQAVTRLRFRIVDITTLNSPGAGPSQADLRAQNSTDYTAVCVGAGGGCTGPGATASIQGTTIEVPPAQPNGGGLNTSVTTTLPGAGLAPGASISVQFLLGVQQGGTFRFFINVEALPAPPGLAGSAKTNATKTARAVKQ